ncbi:hypothetical protein [Ascidiaceihabitans sp.]|uniref:hypothetical protein n=1 Tax=Ascidiaceihabitans sp. TaxID=1872644 RepID=UPI003299B321
MKTVLSALVATAILTVPAQAQTFRAENRVVVTPAQGNSFSISNGEGQGARGMWCAASDYAQDVLGARGSERLVVDQPRTSKRGPVVFALKGRDGGSGSVLIVGSSLRSAGSSLSVNHAYQFCHDARITNSR